MAALAPGEPGIAPYGSQVFQFEVENGLDETRRLDESASGTSTDLCPYFFSPNGCTRGDRCQWRHARNDRLIVCKHYLRGLCKKQDLCDYLHSVDYGRMPECFFFSKYGECSNAECPYRHVDPEKKRNECPYYARGFCRHGPKCRHRHVKKVACPNYLAGFCKDGPDCVFGHARFEIPRTVDDEDMFSNGIDRFGFGRSRGPAPRLITLENGVLATAAGTTLPPTSNQHGSEYSTVKTYGHRRRENRKYDIKHIQHRYRQAQGHEDQQSPLGGEPKKSCPVCYVHITEKWIRHLISHVWYLVFTAINEATMTSVIRSYSFYL